MNHLVQDHVSRATFLVNMYSKCMFYCSSVSIGAVFAAGATAANANSIFLFALLLH